MPRSAASDAESLRGTAGTGEVVTFTVAVDLRGPDAPSDHHRILGSLLAVTLTDAALAADLAATPVNCCSRCARRWASDDPYDLGDAGDKRANTLILDGLRGHRPDDAVLSEEAVDDLSRVRRRPGVDRRPGRRHPGVLHAGRDDWAVHIALWQRGRDGPTGAHHRRRGRAARARRGVPHRHRHPAAARSRGPDPHHRQRQPAARGAVAAGATRWTSSWSASGRRAPRRWPWSAATSTPTCMRAASGSGTRPPPPAWCGRQACTRRGWTARR